MINLQAGIGLVRTQPHKARAAHMKPGHSLFGDCSKELFQCQFLPLGSPLEQGPLTQMKGSSQREFLMAEIQVRMLPFEITFALLIDTIPFERPQETFFFILTVKN